MQKEEVCVDFFATLRDELDDYRQAINQNTDELAMSHEHACYIERKIDMLAERIDQLALHIAPQLVSKKNIRALSEREKWVFKALYVLVEEKQWVTYKDVARRLALQDVQVAALIGQLAKKNVPIVKKFSGGRASISLDENFRELQAKENVLKVNAPLSCWL